MKGYELYHKVTGRSYKAYLADRAKRARVVDYDKWIKNPRLYDAEGIDTYANIFKYVRKGNKKRKRRKKNWVQWTYWYPKRKKYKRSKR